MSGHELSREQVVQLLGEVGEILQQQGLEAALYVVGGAAMALEFNARRVTRDVDVSLRAGGGEFWAAAAEVAQRHQLDPRWINSSASAFMTNEPDSAATELNLPGLRIAVASVEHLIAMKLRAMRERDLDDLEVLFRHGGISSPRQAAAIHDRLFDDSYIGYSDPAEAEYAARLVFDRAAARGSPIGTPDTSADG